MLLSSWVCTDHADRAKLSYTVSSHSLKRGSTLTPCTENQEQQPEYSGFADSIALDRVAQFSESLRALATQRGRGFVMIRTDYYDPPGYNRAVYDESTFWTWYSGIFAPADLMQQENLLRR